MLRNRSLQFKIMSAVAVPLVLVVALAAVAFSNVHTLSATARLVDDAHVVMRDTADLEAGAAEMAAGVRGYLLAGHDESLARYEDGRRRFAARVTTLRDAVRDDPVQIDLLARADAAIAAWTDEVAEPTIALRRSAGDGETLDDLALLIGTAPAERHVEGCRALIDRFTQREIELLRERRAQDATVVDEIRTVGTRLDAHSLAAMQTQDVIGVARDVLTLVLDMETSLRGFLLAGDDAFLENYAGAQAELVTALDQARSMVREDPRQVALLDDLVATLAGWEADVTEPWIMLRRQIDADWTMDDVAALIGESRDNPSMDSIRAGLSSFIEHELQKLYAERGEAAAAMQHLHASLESIMTTAHDSEQGLAAVAAVGGLLGHVADIDASLRGHLLAGTDDSLARYRGHRRAFDAAIAALQDASAGDQEQVALLDAAQATIHQWHAEVGEPAIALRVRISDAKKMEDLARLALEANGATRLRDFAWALSAFEAGETAKMSEQQALGAALIDRTRAVLLVGTLVAVGIGLIASCLIGLRTRKAMRDTIGALRGVAEGEGDLTGRLDESRGDEAGEIARLFNAFVAHLQSMITSISGDANSVASASTELSATATQMAGGASAMSQQSAAVAAAAEQMAMNMDAMSSSSTQMASNVKSAAQAVETMTASIDDVARNAGSAAQIAENAARIARSSSDRVSELSASAEAIGKVVETIQDIAEQTNLLALNATIESARAGDAGRGFAVVASEVKELARQTGEATEDIRMRILGIQERTEDAVGSIGEVSAVIESVNDASRTIAATVDEQSATTRDIASTLALTAQESEVVSTGVAQSTAAAREITENITGVDEAARQSASGATQTRTASEELSRLGEGLATLVGRFRV